jgi:hypothetical protein
MTGNQLIDLMLQSHRRVHVTGTPENGVIAALDLEGRLFTVVDGRVLNRVVNLPLRIAATGMAIRIREVMPYGQLRREAVLDMNMAQVSGECLLQSPELCGKLCSSLKTSRLYAQK